MLSPAVGWFAAVIVSVPPAAMATVASLALAAVVPAVTPALIVMSFLEARATPSGAMIGRLPRTTSPAVDSMPTCFAVSEAFWRVASPALFTMMFPFRAESWGGVVASPTETALAERTRMSPSVAVMFLPTTSVPVPSVWSSVTFAPEIAPLCLMAVALTPTSPTD